MFTFRGNVDESRLFKKLFCLLCCLPKKAKNSVLKLFLDKQNIDLITKSLDLVNLLNNQESKITFKHWWRQKKLQS